MSPKYGGYFIWPESLRLECVLVPTRNRIGVERTPTASRPNSERVPWKSWGLRRAPQQPQVLAEGRARTECRPNLCRLTTRCRHSLAARLDEGRYAVTGRPLTEDSPLHPYDHGVQTYGRCIQAYDVTVQPYGGAVQPYGCAIPPYGSSVQPYGCAILPYDCGVQPYDHVIQPKGGAIQPKGGAVQPYD